MTAAGYTNDASLSDLWIDSLDTAGASHYNNWLASNLDAAEVFCKPTITGEGSCGTWGTPAEQEAWLRAQCPGEIKKLV